MPDNGLICRWRQARGFVPGDGVEFGDGDAGLEEAARVVEGLELLTGRVDVVVGVARAGPAELRDMQLVERAGDAVVDILGAGIGVEADDPAGESLDERLEDWQGQVSEMASTASGTV